MCSSACVRICMCSCAHVRARACLMVVVATHLIFCGERAARLGWGWVTACPGFFPDR